MSWTSVTPGSAAWTSQQNNAYVLQGYVMDNYVEGSGAETAFQARTASTAAWAERGGLSRLALDLPGTSGSYASTPDSAANSITGDIDIRAKVALDDWSPSTSQAIVAKWASGTERSFQFAITQPNGNVALIFSTDGTAFDDISPGVATGFQNGTTHWVRVTRSASTGDGSTYTSDDGVNWTLLGSETDTAGELFAGTQSVEIGAVFGGTANRFSGVIHYVEVRNGIDGEIVLLFDPSNDADTTNSLAFNSRIGGEWTLHGNAVFINTATAWATTAPSTGTTWV